MGANLSIRVYTNDSRQSCCQVSLDLTVNSCLEESDLFGVLLGCGGRQVKRSISRTGGVSACVCGGGWGTLFNHIFYLFSSLIAMTVAAPSAPTTLAGRLRPWKPTLPSLHLWWGSGSGQLQPNLVLIWGHRSAWIQVIYTSDPSPPTKRVVRGRKRKSHSRFPVNNNWLSRVGTVFTCKCSPEKTNRDWIPLWFPPVSSHQHAADRLYTVIRLLLFIWSFCCQSLFCRMTDNSPERQTSDVTHHAKPP